MSVWTEPSPSDFDRWEQRIANGEDLVEAANAEGHTSSAFRRADARRHAEVKALWHEVQGIEDRTTARDTLRAIAMNPDADANVRVRAAELVGKSSGYIGDTTRVELFGEAQVEVTVEHDYGRLLDKLEQLGLVQRGPQAAVDAAPLSLLSSRSD